MKRCRSRCSDAQTLGIERKGTFPNSIVMSIIARVDQRIQFRKSVLCLRRYQQYQQFLLCCGPAFCSTSVRSTLFDFSLDEIARLSRHVISQMRSKGQTPDAWLWHGLAFPIVQCGARTWGLTSSISWAGHNCA